MSTNLPKSDEEELRHRTPVVSPEGADSVPQSDEEDGILTEERVEKIMAEASASQQTSSQPSETYVDSVLSHLPPRWRNWIIRGVFTWLMIGGFALIIYKGPLWLMFLVFAIQIKCFQEIISIGYAVYRVHNLPWFRVLSWWFLLTSNYFFFFESLIDYFKIALRKEEFLHPLVKYRRLIAFALYILGFVGFVLSLRKRYYLRQFSLFAWTHVTLLIVVSQSFFIIQNIFEGMIWFLVPVSMIICNDIMAYMFGFFFGKTPLIQLSPKKTWEGFVGGAISTILFGFAIRVAPTIKFYPFMIHSLVMALFASIIGPFGGFFASGFKRAFKIKDFGDVIPGHGGLMDRFDCQLLMGTFVHVYVSSFIRMPDTFRIVQHIENLRPDQQMEIYTLLQSRLTLSGLLNSTATL